MEPRTALSFALVLHELITNAIKHGSLSSGQGKVKLGWEKVVKADKTWLVFTWVESGGPPVQNTTRRGFGRTLLERVFAEDVSGKVVLAMEPEGVRCTIDIPFNKIVIGRSGPVKSDGQALPQPSALSLDGKKVFVVEDDGLIAIDVTDVLQQAGAIVIGPYGHLAEGLSAAAEKDFDVALLDVNLRGIPSWPIASLIQERGIPVVLSTGYSESFRRPAAMAKLPTVSKPYDTKRLLGELTAALSAKPSLDNFPAQAS